MSCVRCSAGTSTVASTRSGDADTSVHALLTCTPRHPVKTADDKFFAVKVEPHDELVCALAAPLVATHSALHSGSSRVRCRDSPILDVAKTLAHKETSSKSRDKRTSGDAHGSASKWVSEISIGQAQDAAHAAAQSEQPGNAHWLPHTLDTEEQSRLEALFGAPAHGQVCSLASASTELTPAAWTAREMHHPRGRLSVRRVRCCPVAVCEACSSRRTLFAGLGCSACARE